MKISKPHTSLPINRTRRPTSLGHRHWANTCLKVLRATASPLLPTGNLGVVCIIKKGGGDTGIDTGHGHVRKLGPRLYPALRLWPSAANATCRPLVSPALGRRHHRRRHRHSRGSHSHRRGCHLRRSGCCPPLLRRGRAGALSLQRLRRLSSAATTLHTPAGLPPTAAAPDGSAAVAACRSATTSSRSHALRAGDHPAPCAVHAASHAVLP